MDSMVRFRAPVVVKRIDRARVVFQEALPSFLDGGTQIPAVHVARPLTATCAAALSFLIGTTFLNSRQGEFGNIRVESQIFFIGRAARKTSIRLRVRCAT